MAAWLATQGHLVNRKRVQRLRGCWDWLRSINGRTPAKPAAAHKIFPYLLGGLAIEKVNPRRRHLHSDGQGLSLPGGHDGLGRAVLAWRLSNTLGADFWLRRSREALARYGRPEIFNTDQGSQFTSDDFIGILKR